MKKLSFVADKVKIFGPKVDGSFTVSFEVGEYEQEKIAELLRIPQQTPLRIRVKFYGEEKD